MVLEREAIARAQPKPLALPPLAVAARDHEIEVARLGLLEQRGDQLGRMLEVGVHDADPRGPRRANALHARPRRGRRCGGWTPGAGSTISRLLRAGSRLDCLRRPVGAGVDEDDLHGDGGQHRLEALDQPATLPRSFFVGTTTDSKGSSRRTRPALPGDSRRGSRTDMVVFDCKADPPPGPGALDGAATRRRGQRKRAVPSAASGELVIFLP